MPKRRTCRLCFRDTALHGWSSGSRMKQDFQEVQELCTKCRDTALHGLSGSSGSSGSIAVGHKLFEAAHVIEEEADAAHDIESTITRRKIIDNWGGRSQFIHNFWQKPNSMPIFRGDFGYASPWCCFTVVFPNHCICMQQLRPFFNSTTTIAFCIAV